MRLTAAQKAASIKEKPRNYVYLRSARINMMAIKTLTPLLKP